MSTTSWNLSILRLDNWSSTVTKCSESPNEMPFRNYYELNIIGLYSEYEVPHFWTDTFYPRSYCAQKYSPAISSTSTLEMIGKSWVRWLVPYHVRAVNSMPSFAPTNTYCEDRIHSAFTDFDMDIDILLASELTPQPTSQKSSITSKDSFGFEEKTLCIHSSNVICSPDNEGKSEVVHISSRKTQY